MAGSNPSVLIVGSGVFGTSTAYHLKRRQPSWTVTVVDRAPSPPEAAASTDINKIVRADYSVPFYAALAYEAIEAWQAWPSLKPYYHRTGWVALAEQGSDFAERIRAMFRQSGRDPTSDVSLADLEQRWGGCLRGTDSAGFRDAYWNPEAGWCEADRATAGLTDEAVSLGVHYVCAEVAQVLTDGPKALGVKLKDDRTLKADKTVLATGAWTSALLAGTEDELGVDDADRVERQAQAAGVAVAHFEMSDDEMARLAEMPVVVYGENGEVIPPPSNRLLKFTNANTFTNTVTTASGRKISVPPDGSQLTVSKKLQAETHDTMVSRVMPAFASGKEAAYWRICWDSRTPSQDWLLAPHPKISGLYLAVGGSFHSYKFLPNVGKYMANVIVGDGNGRERDDAWKWKDAPFSGRGVHETTAPKRELRDMLDD